MHDNAPVIFTCAFERTAKNKVFFKVERGPWPILHHLASALLGFGAAPDAPPELGSAHFSGPFWSGAIADYLSSFPSPHPRRSPSMCEAEMTQSPFQDSFGLKSNKGNPRKSRIES